MSQFIGTAPGIDFREQVEEANKSQGISNAIGIVGVAKKGPLEVTLLTSPQQCISIFGDAPANNSAIKGALACLKNSREVYFKRVVSTNASKGTTWAPKVITGTDAIGTISASASTVTGTLTKLPVVAGSVVVKVGEVAQLADDGQGNLTDVTGNTGTVNYITGEVTVNLAAVVAEDTAVSVEYAQNENTAAPWAVFSTKDITELYNGWTVTLEWVNEGTEDAPDYKVSYQLKDASGNLQESYNCDEAATDDLYLGKIINFYSSYLDVEITGEPANRDKVTYVIASGNSGLDATVDDIVGTGNSGMQAFYDPESVDIATLIVPTWSDKKVWVEGIKIGEYRKDIVFIPSLPLGLTPARVQDLVRGAGEYTTKGLQFDRTFVPVYWPNGLIKNADTGAMDPVDIAPYIAATYAYSDSVSNIWTAPAGVKRGVIQGLDGLEYKTTKEERDTLYAPELNVNSVVDVRGHGITIMGVRTSKVYKITAGNTALRYINIRRLCNYARKVVLQESMNNLFDQNDYYTWNDWKMRIDPYFRAIKEGRGLYDYQIIMDESTVSQADVDAGRMPGTIKIAPIKPNEYIIINFVVAKDGTVSFSDAVEV